MSNFTDYQTHIGSRPDRFFKGTLFQGQMMLVGINCFEPGQAQAVHDHADQDKVYIVMDGVGRFTVGGETQDVSAGGVVWAAAGVPHGVENAGITRLSVLVCIAPPPSH